MILPVNGQMVAAKAHHLCIPNNLKHKPEVRNPNFKGL